MNMEVTSFINTKALEHLFQLYTSRRNNNMIKNKFLNSSSVLWRRASLTSPSLCLKLITQNFCSQVQKGGPADLAGLEDEDIIIEVNGVNVLDEPYEKVVDRIQSSGKNVTLLVCGKKAYDYFQAKKIPIVSSLADPLDTPPDSKEGTVVESGHDSHMAKERVSGGLFLFVI